MTIDVATVYGRDMIGAIGYGAGLADAASSNVLPNHGSEAYKQLTIINDGETIARKAFQYAYDNAVRFYSKHN